MKLLLNRIYLYILDSWWVEYLYDNRNDIPNIIYGVFKRLLDDFDRCDQLNKIEYDILTEIVWLYWNEHDDIPNVDVDYIESEWIRRFVFDNSTDLINDIYYKSHNNRNPVTVYYWITENPYNIVKYAITRVSNNLKQS